MSNSKTKRKPSKRRFEKRNYQDAAMEREYRKGEKAAEDKECKFPNPRVKSTSNDPQWYFKDKQILNDVASFSFNQPLGRDIHFTNFHTPTSTPGYNNNCVGLSAVPGLMAVSIGLTVGVSDSAQSPVNLAAVNAYSYVRYKNSGAANYDQTDLMLYYIALDSVYACWNWMKRIYGMAATYSSRNMYMPRAYMMANGVDYDDIMQNLADFRGWLNIKAQEIASYCIPATMTYNVRHSWLFANVFKDSNTAKAQQYMYVPAWFFQYDETTSPKGGQLNVVPITINQTAGYKFADLKNILNGMLEALNYSEDIGIMSGDILKAYGEGGLFTLSSIPDDYRVEPVYSEEVLTQIENLQPYDVPSAQIQQFAITQDPDTNFIISKPTITGRNNPRSGGYLNFHWQDPTPEQVMVATRLKYTTVTTEPSTTIFTSMGTELATGVMMYGMMKGDYSTHYNDVLEGNTNPLVIHWIAAQDISYPVVGTTTAQLRAIAGYLTMIGWLIAFDWGPAFMIGYQTNTDNTTQYWTCGTTRDWDNYVYLEDSDIEALNLLATLTEFNVPN